MTDNQADENKNEIEALLTAIEATAPSILKSLQNTIVITDAMTATLVPGGAGPGTGREARGGSGA